jgi:hypothetical protein
MLLPASSQASIRKVRGELLKCSWMHFWEKEDERCSNIPILDVESGGMCQEAHLLGSKCLQFNIEVSYSL